MRRETQGIDRCDDCGGHLSGSHLGFEVECRCFRGRRPKRAKPPAADVPERGFEPLAPYEV